MYFPVAGKINPIYRERVYCYELYHQMRVALGNDYPYSLGGEVDKARHPILQHFALDKLKPDLLVHQPGDMGGNLVVIEVKSIKAETRFIKKDLIGLTSFVVNGRYFRAIYLVYGGNNNDFVKFKRRALFQAQKLGRFQIDLRLIDLYWHQDAGRPAVLIEWDAG